MLGHDEPGQSLHKGITAVMAVSEPLITIGVSEAKSQGWQNFFLPVLLTFTVYLTSDYTDLCRLFTSRTPGALTVTNLSS